jgi:hypothetical protein
MDIIALFNSLPPGGQGVVLALLLLSASASHICALTPTPAPNTLAGKFYRLLEMVGGLYGFAKQAGVPVLTTQDIIGRLTAMAAAGKPLDARALTELLAPPGCVPAPPLRAATDSAPAPAPAAPAAAPVAAVGIAAVLMMLLTLALSACAMPPAPKTPAQTIFDIRAAYDATVLAPAVAYNTLSRCTETVPAPCSDPAAVTQIRKADAAAAAALDAAEDVVRHHPDLDASAAIAAACNAVAAAQQILAIYSNVNVKG